MSGAGKKASHAALQPAIATPADTNKEEWIDNRPSQDDFIVAARSSSRMATPAAGVKYVLIAPDGEFMDGESSGLSKGEGYLGQDKGQWNIRVSGQSKGHRHLHYGGSGAVHRSAKRRTTNRQPKGNVVCKRLDGSSPFKVVVRPFSKAGPTVNPIITLASSVVVVKKSYTNPARQLVTLTSDGPFFRSGTVTRVGTAIRFFDAVVNGTEITFNGTDNVFTGSQLSAGVQLFTDSLTPSVALDDVELTLTLTPGATPLGRPRSQQ